MDNNEEIFGSVEPVVEEKEDMIDFGLLENEKAAQHIDHNLEECIEGASALEAFSGILTAAGWDGVSKQTAAAMAIALRRIDRQTGHRGALTAALEDETGGELARIGNEQSGAANKSGVGGRLKEMWTRFITWVKEQASKLADRFKAWRADFSEKAGKKIESIKKTLASYSPNDKDGGRTVNVSAKLATYGYINGKHTDLANTLVLQKWVKDTLAPEVLKKANAIKGLKGTESTDEISNLFVTSFTEPPAVPEGTKYTPYRGLIFPEAEPTQVKVRTRSERSAALKIITDINKQSAEMRDEIGKVANDLTAMSMTMGKIGLDTEHNLFKVLMEKIGHVIKLGEAVFEVNKAISNIVLACCDIMLTETGGKEEEVSNEDFDYGMEDGNKFRKAWERMVQFFKELWEKGKAKWDKLTRASEVLESKIETTKEEVKQTKQAEAPEEKKESGGQRTSSIDAQMATRIFNGDKLVMPHEFLEFGKYTTEQIPAVLAPVVDQLVKAFEANDAEAINALKVELPTFDGDLPNGNKINYENGLANLIIIEGEAFEYPTPDFQQSMKILDESNAQTKLGKKEKTSGTDVGSLNAKMLALNGAIIKKLNVPEYSDSVKAGLEAQQRVSAVVKSAQKLTHHYYDCIFEYMSFTLM